MSDEPTADLRAVADYFDLPGAGPVAKDFAVLRAIRALAALDVAPFALISGGGTALPRARKFVQRMSEDVDFKIVPTPAAPVTRSGLRRQRSVSRDRVTAALQAAGFAFDPKDVVKSRVARSAPVRVPAGTPP